jgi:hypothetical protein
MPMKSWLLVVAGCVVALAIVRISMDGNREPGSANGAGVITHSSQVAAAGRLISLPGPATPLESIDPDSLQSINPIHTVPRNRRLQGRAGQQWAQDNVIGLTFQQADELAAPRGLSVRIIQIDGRSMPVFDDRALVRINVALADERIVRIDGMG